MGKNVVWLGLTAIVAALAFVAAALAHTYDTLDQLGYYSGEGGQALCLRINSRESGSTLYGYYNVQSRVATHSECGSALYKPAGWLGIYGQLFAYRNGWYICSETGWITTKQQNWLISMSSTIYPPRCGGGQSYGYADHGVVWFNNAWRPNPSAGLWGGDHYIP